MDQLGHNLFVDNGTQRIKRLISPFQNLVFNTILGFGCICNQGNEITKLLTHFHDILNAIPSKKISEEEHFRLHITISV